MTIFIKKAETASFDVDAQKTFTPLCPDELPVPAGDTIVTALNQQARFAGLRLGSKDAHSHQAVWIADEQHPILSAIEGDNVDVRWPLHAVPGSKGFELLDGLPHPASYDYFVWKGIEPDMHPYGACYHDLGNTLSTGVIEFLHTQAINTVLVGGLALEHCVKTTALQLQAAGLQVILNLASSRGLDDRDCERAIYNMRQVGVKIITSTAELELQ